MTEDKGAWDSERRSSERLPIEIWVEQASERELYFQRGANISTGGIFLKHTIPHSRGTRVRLRFTLPGEPALIEVTAEIVNVGDGDADLGMGLRFLDLPEDDRRRIESFIERARRNGSGGDHSGG